MDASDLNDLQGRLEAHFSSIATSRERSGFPVFALEHGLDAVELKRLNDALRSRQSGGPNSPHWLLWVVYATEAGYGYKGDEYWPSFREQTPNWEHQDNPKVKSWFRMFQRSFNGVEPSGPWAEYFSIIAWPITNALLPRYLQRQFARLLFDLRVRLASASLDAGSIGRLLATHASHTSTRFQAFLEQEELTGQIVAALLQQESVEDDQLIHRATLERVVSDLEHVRSSREWLKETRRVVSDRFKGIGRGTPRPPSPTSTGWSPDEPAMPDASQFAIRPDICLRHVGDGKWSALIQFKSLRPLAAESDQLRKFLDRTRCRLNGAEDWKPTGWLLSGNRKGALRNWPNADLPLIEFEQTDPLMEHYLQLEYRLTPGPVWLFRVGTDGIARHLASPTVRPSNDYIVVTAGSFPDDLPGSAPCALECSGVHALRLSVPGQTSEGVTERFQQLGISVARTIRVWPAGLPGRGWDGEGKTEWLTTEAPCFGVAPDHPLDALSFRLNGGAEQVVAMEPGGTTTFVQLPPLRAGNHELVVEAHRTRDLNRLVTAPPAKGFVELAVREPEPWTPGVTTHSGFIVMPDPFDASLDTLWRNEVKLSVNGPEGSTVSVDVKLHGADGHEVLSESMPNSMPLPIDSDAWHRAFGLFLEDEGRAWKYLEAASCTLEFNGDSLGACAIRFDHDPSPLRWVLGSQRRRTTVRLVDDTGRHDMAPEVRFYGMDRPLDLVPLDVETAMAGFDACPPGGLFLATNSTFADAAVVSVPAPQPGLKDIGVRPSVYVQGNAPALCSAFELLRAWHQARQAGFHSEIRLLQIVRAIVEAITRAVCGETWAKAESSFTEMPASRDGRHDLETLVQKGSSVGYHLSQQSDPNDSEAEAIARFTAEARRRNLASDPELCRFALRFAICPVDVLGDPSLIDRASQLAGHSALLRGARLMALFRKHGPATRHPSRPGART